MNDMAESLIEFAARAFVPLMLAGPAVFLILFPLVRERRRRAVDGRYRKRAEAYAAIRKFPGNSPEKWNAFLGFMAASFGSDGRAWTPGDSNNALRSVGAPAEVIDQIAAMHAGVDASDFSLDRPGARFADLDDLAGQVMRLVSKSTLVCLLAALFFPLETRADDWSDALSLFTAAESATAGSDAAKDLYMDSALKFQAVALAGVRPGVAWYNAGNAWFQTGEMGRSIACYRRAYLHRPFDPKLVDNLAAARAMTSNDVPDARPAWRRIPSSWIKSATVILNACFWVILLVVFRYRKRWLKFLALGTGLVLLAAVGLIVAAGYSGHREGVVVVDSVIARKGPGYSYADAFNEPLHDGLEFTLIDVRDDWGMIQLTDGRQCWVPMGPIELIGDF